MPDGFMRGIEALNGIVWGPMGLGLLFGTGLLLTVRTGGFQLRRWGYWMRHTLGAILTDRSVTAHTAREEQAISQFQSLCTALASTIGTLWGWPPPSFPAGRGRCSGCGSWRCWA